MADTSCCFAGRGKVSIGAYNNGAEVSFFEVGNVESFNISQTLSEKKKKDYTGAGGDACAITEIDSVKATLQATCWKISNLKLAMNGSGSHQNVAAGSIVNEAHVVTAVDQVIPFANIPDGVALTTVVTNTAGTTTYALGTDYELTTAGIKIKTGTTIPMASTIHIDYAYAIQSKVEGLTTLAGYYSILFEGVNAANTSEKVKLVIHKALLAPAGEIGIISDDFASLNLDATLVQDSNIVATGLSKYYTMQRT
jgi:hypothetical protein